MSFVPAAQQLVRLQRASPTAFPLLPQQGTTAELSRVSFIIEQETEGQQGEQAVLSSCRQQYHGRLASILFFIPISPLSLAWEPSAHTVPSKQLTTAVAMSMLQKIRSSAAEIRRRIPGQQSAPTDAAFERAKQQWISLEQSVQLLQAEVINYKKEMAGIAHNGVQMMNKIVQMFEQPAAAAPQTSPTAAAAVGAVGGSGVGGGEAEWPDPNENHPYKDVAQLMKKTQERIQQEDIAVSTRT